MCSSIELQSNFYKQNQLLNQSKVHFSSVKPLKTLAHINIYL